jgi:hypothetical protein
MEALTIVLVKNRRRAVGATFWNVGDANSTWMKIFICIRKVASKEFEVIKEGKRETKETWW